MVEYFLMKSSRTSESVLSSCLSSLVRLVLPSLICLACNTWPHFEHLEIWLSYKFLNMDGLRAFSPNINFIKLKILNYFTKKCFTKLQKSSWTNSRRLWKKRKYLCPRSNGLVVRAVACEARGPGFDSSSDQMVFSLLGYKEVGKNGSRHDKLHDLAYPCRK